MNRILKLSFLEFKNILRDKLLIFSFIVMAIIMMLPPYSGIDIKFKSIYLNVTIILMMVLFSTILSGDFENKTSKIIFSGSLSRTNVLVWKLISILFITIFLFVVYIVMTIIVTYIIGNNVITVLNIEEIRKCFFRFIILGTCLGTFAMMISSITFSTVISFITSFVFFDGIIANLISIIAERFEVEIVREIIKNTPFYSVTYGFRNGVYQSNEIKSIIVSTILFMIITIIIIKKRDLK